MKRSSLTRRSALSRLSSLRKLRCEPLEDRRMLSVLFVDDEAAAGGDGLAWSSAYGDLQDALSQAAVLKADADPGNDVDQIWIAEGVYRPSAELEPGVARSAAFSLVDGVTLYGGFGGTETAVVERDVSEHVTTLSGDIGVAGDAADNAYTVVYCGEEIIATLDGVTITGGNANGEYDSSRLERTNGGGILTAGWLAIVDSILRGNTARYGGGIYNDEHGILTIANSTISRNAAVDHGNGGGVFNDSQGTVMITGSTFRGNSGSNGGGIYSRYGELTVTDSTFSRNESYGDYGGGGGIYNLYGTWTIGNSTFSANTAVYDGGAIHNYYDQSIAITDSTFHGNSAGHNGGSIATRGTLAIANGAFSGNSAGNEGGGIYGSGRLTVANSTFARNSAGYGGGGIHNDYKLNLYNSILWRNDGGELGDWDDIHALSNLIGVDPGFVRDPSDGGDGWGDDPSTPEIDESANDDYGDLRLTPQSAAVDLGDNDATVDAEFNPLETDLNGNTRIYGDSVDCGVFELQEAAAAGREAPSLVVTTSDDAFDLYDGQVSLREAIFYAGDALPETTVAFDEALNGATILLDGTSLWIDKALSIDASSLDSLTIDAGWRSRAFTVVGGEQDVVELTNLAITGGLVGDEGGGIRNSRTLTVSNCNLFGNAASYGGGIFNLGTLTVVNSTLSGNSTSGIDSYGGGICNRSKLTVVNSVICGNAAHYSGGGIYSYGFFELHNSILWQNGGGDLYDGSSFSSDSSLIGIDPKFVRDPSDGGDGWGDDLGTPGVDESANDDYGDLRLTSRSPVVDYGDDASAVGAEGNPLATDRDGRPRIYGTAVDCGALEYQDAPAAGREAPSLTVTTSEDSLDPYDGRISLREAIQYAGEASLGTRITFDAALDGATIRLAGASLLIDHSLVIDASSLGSLSIDADYQSRVFTIAAGEEDEVELRHLMLIGGSAMNGAGIHNSGPLTVTNCAFSGNLSRQWGGGVLNQGGTLTVTGSTLSGNSASFAGGGIYNSAGTLTLNNSILAGNTARYGWDVYHNPDGGFLEDPGTGTQTGSHNLIGHDSLDSNGNGTCQTFRNGIDGNLVGFSDNPIDPRFLRTPSDGGDGWQDSPYTPDIDESANNDYGNFRLFADSPAMDAGDNTLIPVDRFDLDGDGDTTEPIPVDLAGAARVQDGDGDQTATVNMGAYETSAGMPPGDTEVLYVNAAAFPTGDGTSWAAAFDNLQDALARAASRNTDADVGNDVGQIWIAEGIYRPSAELTPGDSRTASFRLVNGVALHGGFSGTETVLSERDLSLHETILSGDLGVVGDRSDNAYTVVYCAEDVTSALDGVTITGGNADAPYSGYYSEDNNGGGICIWGGTLTVANCTLSGNSASGPHGEGGGIFSYDSVLTVTNCSLSGNRAGVQGGGIYSGGGTKLTVTNSTLSGNSALFRGGGIYSLDAPTLCNSILWQNPGGDLDTYRSASTSGNMIGIDPKLVRDPSDGGDGWGDDPETPDIDESANDDFGDLRLTARSPAIDRGDDSLAVDASGSVLATDLDGNDRIYGTSVDCGAFEFQAAPADGRETPSLVVDTTEDVLDLYDGRISLREAIYYAGTDSLGTTVTFDTALDGATITLGGTSLWIDKPLTIDASSLTIDGNHQSRVFTIMANDEDEVVLNALTISGGFATRSGGGVYNHRGILSMVNCTISGNSADRSGGAISNGGTLTLVDSVVSHNSSAGFGGGIDNRGTMTVMNSMILANLAEDGGGGLSNSGTLTVTNSVVSGNTSNGDDYDGGGGIANYGTLTVTNSTVAGNAANFGGGVYTYQFGREYALIINNTIIAENVAELGPDLWDDRYNYFTGSHNLIGDGSDQRLANGGHGNLVGTSENPINPRFVRNPSDGGDGWGDDPNTPDIDESANDDYGDLRLRVESPAVDAGDTTLLPADSTDLDGDGDMLEAIPIDLAGDARVQDGNGDHAAIVNMGAYETPVGTPPGDVTILYVAAAVSSPGDGSSWSAAFADLQDALDRAADLKADGDWTNDVNQIWIAEGVYKPSVELVPGDPRSASFSLVNGITLYGGFAGTETEVTQRDWTARETVLSGDLGVADDPADNVYTVVYCDRAVVTTLNGVTVTGGNADGPENPDPENPPLHPESRSGGGIYNRGTLTVTSASISGNSANRGGGVFNIGMLTVISSTLSDNVAGGGGGGVYNVESATLYVVNSTLSQNAAYAGGGVCNNGTLIASNTAFWGNAVTTYGGGIYHYSTPLTITNCVFVGNTAERGGGGVFSYNTFSISEEPLTVTNCTLSGNTSSAGAGIYSRDPLTLNNSLLWQNGDKDIYYEGALSATHNLIEIDPGFVRDPSDGGDGWGDDPGTPDVDESTNDDYGDLHLRARSIAINYGDDSLAVAGNGVRLMTDLDGNPRNYGGSPVDTGAFEFQGEVSGREEASLIVNTAEDILDLYDGRISLRDAIYYAGVASPDTTITFDSALDGTTITLAGTSLSIDKPLTIDASSLESLTIDADERSRVFDVAVSNGGEVTLNALTITGGFTTEDGGGIYNQQSTLSILNCTISGNSAAADGGGIFNAPRTETLVTRPAVEISPIPVGSLIGYGTIPVNVGNPPVELAVFGKVAVTNCTISGNSAINGGGIRNEGEMSVAGSTFSDNSATNTGGGISNGIEAALTVTNSTFQGNAITTNAFSRRCGGGISNDGTLRMNNCSVVGNLARYGGGISNAGLLTVTNSTIAGNSATSGGGIYNSKAGISAIYGGGVHGALASALASVGGIPSTAKLTLHNSILWQNSAGDLFHASSGVFSDSHNLIGIDPLFVRDPANDDYGDLRLRADSPAIDQGDSGLLPEDTLDLDRDGNRAEPVPFDLGGNARVVGGAVDMGAYEYFALWGIPGDLNNDYSVNSADLDIVRANWGRTVTPGSLPGGDPSGDGLVNLVDLNLVRANWGTTTPMAASVRAATGASVHSKAVSGPRTASDATDTALRNWDQAELAWAKEVEAIATRQRRDVKTATRAAAVDLVLFGWE